MEMANINPMSRVEELFTQGTSPSNAPNIEVLCQQIEEFVEEKLKQSQQNLALLCQQVQVLQGEIQQLKKDNEQLKKEIEQHGKKVEDFPKTMVGILTNLPTTQVNLSVNDRLVDKQIEYDELNRPTRVKELQRTEIKELK